MDETTVLFRPVGQKELDLIREKSCREFPPRLSYQPIFYPVLNEEYAKQIARDQYFARTIRYPITSSCSP